MSFSPPYAYGIQKMGAEVQTNTLDGRDHSWLELRFFDHLKKEPDRMTIHFEQGSLPKFQRLAALITELFGENTTQETSSEV